MDNHFQVSSTKLKPGQTKEEQQVEEDASLLAMKMSNANAFPMVLKAALELGVIDTIATVGHGLWLSSSEIALRLPTKPSNPEAPVLLERMLRFLASYSVFKCRTVALEENGQTEKVERVYAAEPVCKYLVNNSDISGSFAPLSMVHLSDVYNKTWLHLKDVILEGSDAFSCAHGMKVFEYFQTDTKFGEVFNRAMLESSTIAIEKLLNVYEGFKDVKTLVDVGGGLGHTLSLITSKYPHIMGIKFDLPPVLARASPYPGVQHVAGDMFTEIPNGDAIFMKVIIVEMVTPVEAKSGDIFSNIVFGMDMAMLTQCSGGKERSLTEFEALSLASGFARCDIVCPVNPFSVIEIYK
ncbi:unnamed protein product [Microthlaspi erraticum]|uniref:O-methyltransferase domain-containing protein n=1 Tax=Microthlaspi erraticum TaxID=1685480 RepID=A0A6D2KND8_9BRAS|nr:unnamed protein product [Microthlaspi erraticum]